MDTKASGLKCHEKQDSHMVSENLCKTPVNNKEEKNCNFENCQKPSQPSSNSA